MPQKIKLNKLTSSKSLMTRDLADLLFSNLKITNKIDIDIDFSDIDFVSRSFADQFYKNKLKTEQVHPITIQFIHWNESIELIFKEVIKTNSKDFSRTYKKSNYLVSHIQSPEELSRLNLSF